MCVQGVTTKDSAVGPPDVYPNAFDSVHAWTPYIDNDGLQTMEFTIRTCVAPHTRVCNARIRAALQK